VRTPPRTPFKASIVETARRAESYLSSEELAAAAGISSVTLARLVRLGLVEPTALRRSERGATAPVFSAATASRLRRMLRLHRDLGVNLTGAAIIVDLVERLERELGRPGR
jgi:DNA-binding transcriptional MerR regulator